MCSIVSCYYVTGALRRLESVTAVRMIAMLQNQVRNLPSFCNHTTVYHVPAFPYCVPTSARQIGGRLRVPSIVTSPSLKCVSCSCTYDPISKGVVMFSARSSMPVYQVMITRGAGFACGYLSIFLCHTHVCPPPHHRQSQTL